MRAWDRLASRRARMVSGVLIRAAPERPFITLVIRVVVNRLAYKFYEGPVTFYLQRLPLTFMVTVRFFVFITRADVHISV